MPDKVIDIPGHGTMSFSDDMSDDDIAKAISKIVAPKNPQFQKNEEMIAQREAQSKAPTEGSPLKRFGESLWGGIKSGIQGMTEMGRVATDPVYAFTGQDMLNSDNSGAPGLKRLIQPSIDQARAAMDSKTPFLERLGQGLASVTPGGSLGVQIGSQIGEGNIAGAAGTATAPIALSAGMAAIESPKVQGAVKGAASGIRKGLGQTVNVRGFKVPAPIGGALAGEYIGSHTGHSMAGPVLGAVAPIVADAIKGAAQGAAGKPLIGPVTEQFARDMTGNQPTPAPVAPPPVVAPDIPAIFPQGKLSMPTVEDRLPDIFPRSGQAIKSAPPVVYDQPGRVILPDQVTALPPGVGDRSGQAISLAPSERVPGTGKFGPKGTKQTREQYYKSTEAPKTPEIPPEISVEPVIQGPPTNKAEAIAIQRLQYHDRLTYQQAAAKIRESDPKISEAPKTPSESTGAADDVIKDMSQGAIRDKTQSIPPHIVKSMADELGVTTTAMMKHLEDHGFKVESKFNRRTKGSYGVKPKTPDTTDASQP